MRTHRRSGAATVAGMVLTLAAALSAGFAQVAPGPPLSKADVLKMLSNYVSPKVVGEYVEKRGINFRLSATDERDLRRAGADSALLQVLRGVAPEQDGGARTHAARTALGVARKEINFGSQSAGTQSRAQSLIVTNTGTEENHFSLDLPEGEEFLWQNHCPRSLAPGTSCSVSITFRPLARGSCADKITIVDSATDSTEVVELRGIGRE